MALSKRCILRLLCLALTIMSAPSVFADEGLSVRPATGSAHETLNQFDLGLEAPPEKETTFSEILQSSQLRIKLRNYYLNRGKPADIDSYAWAQGASAEYRIGRVNGIASLTAEWMGSFPLEAPLEHDGTLLLEPGQEDISVLGVLNPQIKLGDHTLSLFRQKYNLPYVNEQDNRVVPNTFEGYTIGIPKSANERFQYIVGYVDNIKTRSSDSFVPMSEAAGTDSADRGLIMAGTRYYILPELSLAAINHYTDEALNQFYAESIYKANLSDEIEDTLSVQYSHHATADGDEIRGDEYTGWMWGIQNATSYEGIVLKLAFTDNDPGALLRSPFGSYPGYNSVIVEDFNRAGESAWQAALTYEFKRIGFDGASATVAHIQGNSAVDEITKSNLPDKNETDITLDYKVPKGRPLERFWLRLRAAVIDEEGGPTTEDYRVIVNYDFSLLEPNDS